ncbi:hypothetical protein B484DRAFT_345022 [Ochromonadaceae sp. CCMP2298]|nr:hypothetical protein B484DRAFT_345022 [Ochromonadaceae sp. CCMP2298]
MRRSVIAARGALRHSSRSQAQAQASTSAQAQAEAQAPTPAQPKGPLFDTFGRFHDYLRISLTEKCNLRCLYCMPAEGVALSAKPQLATLEERKQLISIFAELGVRKLRFTGGEPTISNQLTALIAHAKDCGITNIGITSNGLILKPQLATLVAAGLTSVNISLDTLDDQKYASITRRDAKNLPRVMGSIYAAVALGLPVKINCVLMRGFNDLEVSDFVSLTREIALDVRFIELMPFDGNSWSEQKFMGYREVLGGLRKEGIELVRDDGVESSSRNSHSGSSGGGSGGSGTGGSIGDSISGDSSNNSHIDIHSDIHSSVSGKGRSWSHSSGSGGGGGIGIRGTRDPNDTTKWWRAVIGESGKSAYGVSAEGESGNSLSGGKPGNSSGEPGHNGDGDHGSVHLGRVGFITSMSEHFCGTCNRLRITADGKLKVCLFGKDGLDLLALLRGGASTEEVRGALGGAVGAKYRSLGGHKSAQDIAANSGENRPMILIGG